MSHHPLDNIIEIRDAGSQYQTSLSTTEIYKMSSNTPDQAYVDMRRHGVQHMRKSIGPSETMSIIALITGQT